MLKKFHKAPQSKPSLNQASVKLQRALALHQNGQLDKAQVLYEEILNTQPNHIDALHLLGEIALQTNQPEQAISLIDKAISIEANAAMLYYNRGLALNMLKQFEVAVDSYEKAIKLNPDYAEAYFNRGNSLKELQEFDAAIASYDKAIQLKPSFIEAYYNRGNALSACKQFTAAIASYDKAIELKPELVEAHANRGLALKDLNQLDAAIASYDKAIQLKPDYAEAHSNRGNVLRDLKRFDAAVESYENAIQLKPNLAEGHYNRGNVLRDLKQFDAAVESYDTAIQLNPYYVEAHSNRGDALRDLKQFGAAIVSYDTAIRLNPCYVEAHSNRGIALQELKELESAVASYDKAIQLESNYAEAHWNKSLALLLLGDFDNGWVLYEWRWKINDLKFKNRNYSKPLWLGKESLQNKTILIHAEQGLGDTIQFWRYVESVTALSAKAIFEVQPALVPLLTESDPSLSIYPQGTTLPNFDYHCPLMSLPLAFKNNGTTINSNESYIKEDCMRVKKWKNNINSEQFNIGINWHGSAQGNDIGRSFPLIMFEGIASSSKVKLFSLQKNEGTEQLNTLPKGMTIESFGKQVDSQGAFLDTAAIMKNLDLIITSDTAVAHLAGALGCKVWVVLKFVPDWRWVLDKDSSSWYPTMRLFRQKKAGDWKDVFDEIEFELNSFELKNG